MQINSVKNLNTAKGFTLIELIIVIVIIGITSASAVVNFTDMYNKFKLTEQTEKIATQIRYIRDYASSRETVCVIRIDSTFRTEIGKFDDEEEFVMESLLILPGELSATTTFPYPVKLMYDGPLIDGLDDGAYKILFDGKDNDGEPASAGTITATLYDFSKSIRINGIGKVTVLEEYDEYE